MEIDSTKDDYNRMDVEAGDVLVSFDEKKDVISKLHFIITKDQKTGELDLQYYFRNNMKILSKDDKIPKLMQSMMDQFSLLCGYKTPKLDMDNIKLQ